MSKKIKMLTTAAGPNGVFLEGVEYPISVVGEGQAKTWVLCGAARKVEIPNKQEGEKKDGNKANNSTKSGTTKSSGSEKSSEN